MTINCTNASYIAAQAQAIRLSPKFRNSRTIRRLLAVALADASTLTVVLADQNGYSHSQLQRISSYAHRLAHAVAETVEISVNTNYPQEKVTMTVATPSEVDSLALKQLQAILCTVETLASLVLPFAQNPAAVAQFDDYQYRNFPCSIQPDSALWCVSGADIRTGASGVLEWCRSKLDAIEVLSRMGRFPKRFEALDAHPFQAQH